MTDLASSGRPASVGRPRRTRSMPPVLGLMAVLAGCAMLRADVFELTNGARINGTWLNPDQSPRRTYRIELVGGAVVELTKEQVHEVTREPKNLASYRRAVRRMPDTLEAHLKMARLCETAKLEKQRAFHLKQVLRFDPANEEARRGLGYVRIGQQWIMPEERFRRMGYVKHKGKWKLPQEIELDAVKEKDHQDEVQWRQRLKRWRSALLKGKPDARQQALLDLKNARSPYLVPAIERLLEQGKEPKALRRIYIEVLGNLLPDGGAARILARIVIHERDSELVDAALTQLERRDGAQYAWLFVPYLHSKENAVINRAARALGQLGNPAVIPDLIDVLVTKHRRAVTAPGLQVGQGSGGSGGLSAGPASKMVEFTVKNREVLTALTMLSPDSVNFEYDKTLWRRWYARRKTPRYYDVRRDP